MDNKILNQPERTDLKKNMEQEKHIENTKLDGSLKPNTSLIAKNINKVNASIIVRLDKK